MEVRVTRRVVRAVLPVVLAVAAASALFAASDRQSAIENQGSAIENQGSAIGNQGSAIGNREAAIGRRVYDAKKCGRCHMIAGAGNVRFPLDRVGARLTEGELRRWLTDTAEMEAALPRQPAVRMSEWMRSNRKLPDADIEALVAYLASLK